MKRLLNLISLAILLTLWITACQEDSDTGLESTVENDESIVQELAVSEEEELLFDAAIDDRSEDFMYNGYRSFGDDLPDNIDRINNVLRFGRRFDPFPRRQIVDIRHVAPDTIEVSVSRLFTGQFVIFQEGQGSNEIPPPIIIHRKPMRHIVRRNMIFSRTAADPEFDRRHRQWHLEALSLGQGNSLPEATIRILEVTVTSSGGGQFLFTEPLSTFLESREDLPTFAPGEIITVRVKLRNSTENPIDPQGSGSTETVLLHFGANRYHHARKRFDFVGVDDLTGANIYEGSWTIGQQPFHIYHAVVDAIDNGTIYEEDAENFPYNSTTWSVPYRVVDSQ